MSAKGSAKIKKSKQNPGSFSLDGQLLLTTAEAAKILRVSKQTLYTRCREKSVNPFPVMPIRGGGHPRFRVQDILDYIEGRTGDDHE